MAKLSNISAILIIFSLLIATQIEAGADEEAQALFQNILHRKQKLVKLHFYVQDRLSGPNATVFDVASASITNASASSFGLVRVVDDVVTAGPEPTSQILGRAQGQITYADLQTPAISFILNMHFTAGEYNGSTISTVGRSQFSDPIRETVVAGGTGAFRFSSGYTLTEIYSYDAEANYAVIDTTIYAIIVDTTIEQITDL